MIRPLDAWVLRRILTGHSLNGELSTLSERFRPVAGQLDTLDLEGRQHAWEGHLAGCHDAERIVMALAAADPEGPPPGADAPDPTDDWPPLRFSGLPPVEPFPCDVLPEAAARLVADGADAIGCPPDFLGVPVLAVAGGAIGRSVALLLKSGHFAHANLYAGCVGPPSDGKTPGLKQAAAAVRRIDEQLEAEHRQARERWEEEANQKGPEGKKAKPPPPPKPRRIDVDDITMEAVPLILADNPRGLVMIRDELTSFLLGMNQFKGGKGNDRPNALKIWAGDAIKKDRVKHENNEPIRRPHPLLTVVGGLTPDMLGSMLDPKGRADGFVDRFVLAYPDPLPVPPWSDEGVSDETAGAWCSLVARLWHRGMNSKEGRAVPHVARLTPEGKAEWVVRFNAHAAEMNGDHFPPSLRGPWGKLREYAGRFALILACMGYAADPTLDPNLVPDVGPRDVKNAWRLVAYFKSHARRVHAAMASGPHVGAGPVVKAVVDWVREGRRPSFSERDIKQARRWVEDEALSDALTYLVTRDAIRRREAPPEVRRLGRPASPAYDVNTALFGPRNPQNTQNDGPTWPFEDSEGSEYREGGE